MNIKKLKKEYLETSWIPALEDAKTERNER